MRKLCPAEHCQSSRRAAAGKGLSRQAEVHVWQTEGPVAVRGTGQSTSLKEWGHCCLQYRAFLCICLRTRLPLFQIAIEHNACTKQGILEAQKGKTCFLPSTRSFYLHHLISFLQSSLRCFRT